VQRASNVRQIQIQISVARCASATPATRAPRVTRVPPENINSSREKAHAPTAAPARTRQQSALVHAWTASLASTHQLVVLLVLRASAPPATRSGTPRALLVQKGSTSQSLAMRLAPTAAPVSSLLRRAQRVRQNVSRAGAANISLLLAAFRASYVQRTNTLSP